MELVAYFEPIAEGKVATFTVVDTVGHPLSAATVRVEGETLATDAAGVAVTTAKLPSGDYTYSVELAGYQSAEGQLKVSSLSAAVRVVLQPAKRYTVTFTVNAEGGRLPGVAITISGNKITTNAEGMATVELPNGAYPYAASKFGYSSVHGSLTVADGTVEVPITLTKQNPNTVESTLLTAVVASPNPCHDMLRLQNITALRTLRMVNTLGQVVRSQAHNGGDELLLPVDDLPAGVYLLHLTDTQGGVLTLRVVKQ